MRKSYFGLSFKKTYLHLLTRCHCLKANEGQNIDSLLFTDKTASTPLLFRDFLTTQQRLRSLTDPTLTLQPTGYFSGRLTGSIAYKVSGLSLMAMPPREQTLCLKKIAGRLLINHQSNHPTLFSSSRYSLAQLGLKGDQNLIC